MQWIYAVLFTKNSQNSIDKVIMKLKEHPSLRTNLFLQRLNVGKNKTLVRNNMSKADFYHPEHGA